MRKFAAVLTVCLLTLTGGLHAGRAHAASDIDWGVSISSGMPPPPIYPGPQVYAPQPRWVADYWYWNGAAYVLIPGHWEQPRNPYGYVQPGWALSSGMPRPYYEYERREGREGREGRRHGHGHDGHRW